MQKMKRSGRTTDPWRTPDNMFRNAMARKKPNFYNNTLLNHKK